MNGYGTTPASISTFLVERPGTQLLPAFPAPLALQATSTSASEAAVDALGRYLYVLYLVNGSGTYSIEQFSIDPGTGAIAPLGELGGLANIRSFALHPNGKFIYLARGNNHQVGVRPLDSLGFPGAQIQSVATGGTGIQGIAIEPLGRFLFAANSASDSVSAFRIDPAAGTLTQVDANPATAGTLDPFPCGGDEPFDLAADSSGAFLYVANAGPAGAGANSVTSFRIASDGFLTAAGPPVQAGTAPKALAVK